MNFADQQPLKAISINVTENCPLRCEYCFCGEKTTRNMDMKVAKDTIDWFLSKETSGNNKDLTIDLWGGEPLMRWSFDKELIAYGNMKAMECGKSISWNATTNGIYLTEEVCTDIKLTKMSFMLSIDGDKETQDHYRPVVGGKSSYDIIKENLPYMKNVYANGNLRARATIREDSVDKVFRNITHIHNELGINELSFSLAHESPWLPESFEEYDKQIGMLADWYLEEKRNGNEKLWMKFIDDTIGRILYPRSMDHFCGAGRSYVGVGVDGVITPCHRFYDFSYEGPVENRPFVLGTIYDGLTNPNLRDLFLTPNSAKGACSQCNLNKQQLCAGSCFAVNEIKSGGDIGIPAHSTCKDTDILTKHVIRIYPELIKLPAFKTNLRKLARTEFKPSLCREKEFGSCDMPMQEIKTIVNEKLNILNSASRALNDVFNALQVVITNEINAEQLKLALLDDTDTL